MVLSLSPFPGEIEVSSEWFSKLKEYDSLSKMRIKHLASIGEQKDRVSKLEEKFNAAHLHVNSLREKNIEIKQNLHEFDSKIKIWQQQKDRIFEDAKIQAFAAQIETAENEGLNLLELLESNEAEIAQDQQFMEGLRKTISEIESESLNEIDKLQGEVSNLDLRLKLILEELPSEYSQTLIKLNLKNLAYGSFTRIQAGSCYFCRYKLSRIEESEVDSARLLKTCPQCTRIFLPYGT